LGRFDNVSSLLEVLRFISNHFADLEAESVFPAEILLDRK